MSKNNLANKHRYLHLTPLQRQELLSSIEDKHEIPHKFAYLHSGAEAWDRVAKASDYDLGRRELCTLGRFMQLASVKLASEPLNIVHIGSGNGVEIPTIVETIGVDQIVHYALLDISSELLKIAKSYGSEHFEALTFLSFTHDATKSNISKIVAALRQNGNRNLVLIIGNGAILSNLCCLDYVTKSMIPIDRLLITLEVYAANREKQILEQYKSPSILNLFEMSLSLIGINNITSKELEFLYNEEKSMVEVYFISKQWLKLHPHEKIAFNISLPEKIKIFSSFRPTVFTLKQFLSSKGFTIETFQYFEKERCCGVVCKIKQD